MNKIVLNLFTTIDASWLPYACMMISSVRKNFQGEINYWIVHEDIEQTNQEIVIKWGADIDINIYFVNFSEIKSSIPIDLSIDFSGPWSNCSVVSFWGRYLGRWLLPKNVRYAVYADVDMLAFGELDELACLDLKRKPVGAVRCPSSLAASEINVMGDQYFNNGLIVFDLNLFDASECISKMKKILQERNLRHGPQCAFSFAMEGNVVGLDDCWNVQGELRSEVGNSARIIHFTGNCKPWHILSTDVLAPHVANYIENTPFPSAWWPDSSIAKHIIMLARKLRKQQIIGRVVDFAYKVAR